MSLALYAHPFSSYCWKVLIALREKDLAFEYRNLEEPGAAEAMAARWPIGRMPVLVDGEQTVAESSIIIEHLDLRHPGARMIPADPEAALAVRFLDRFFDHYVMTPMQQPVAEKLRHGDRLDSVRAESGKALDKAYAWLDATLGERIWAAGDTFGLADCAGAPALFYADWVHPIPAERAQVRAYRERLLARPAVARVVDDARPYRSYFPLGAPDRD
ncbi:glutathione S-transferase family protein [Sphingomonas beigongshangi]|uniref:glutathione S-transferase family protein n=1 Tax=Sphingomonas beigongshangi TaxID=2782540 RepID=UPI00193C5744|nr:glutathione S-transferase family protein [Sphingomonas beigongshangi]